MLFKKSNTSSKSLESFRLLCFKPNSNRSGINGIIEDFLTSSWGIFSNVGSFLLLLCHVIPRRGSTHWGTPTATIGLDSKSCELDCCWLDPCAVQWWVEVLSGPHWWSCWSVAQARREVPGCLHRPAWPLWRRVTDSLGWDQYGFSMLLVLQQGSMTAQRYRDKVLDLHVRPYASAIGDDSLMDDNAPPHRARIVQQYLQQETIVRMDWPARLPDCYPIEHLWDFLQVAVARHQQQPCSLLELENYLVAEWNAVSQIHIQRLIRSMRRRCQAVISARGSHTRYWASHDSLLSLKLDFEKLSHFDKMCK